jgi:hypothetical protein
MQKSALLRELQQEIRRHDFNYFVDQPPSIAQGGRGVVVPGCPACEKRINTMSQFLDHLADNVLPALIEKLSAKPEAIEKIASDESHHQSLDTVSSTPLPNKPS